MADRTATHPTPSQMARELVAGAYDLHVRIAPDLMKRRVDDLALAAFGWLPTVDGADERARAAAAPEGATPPMVVRLQNELRAAGMTADPVDVAGPDGTVLESTRQVLRVIAAHDTTLATGHLGSDEIAAVVGAAVEEGVRRIVVAPHRTAG